MLTSISVFLVVMTISMGSILNVFDVNRKSESMKTVMDNLNFAIESMSREMRFGTKYHCGTSAPLTAPANCSLGDTQVSFLANDNLTQIVYRKAGTTIEKSVDGGNTYIAVTAPEINIENLTFYVLGADIVDTVQPKVLITIQGKSGAKANTTTEFSVQTLVSQRRLDKI